MVGVVLGLLGLVVGVAAWFRAAPTREATTPVYTEQQVADAKKAVCEAYERGVRALEVSGNERPDTPAETISIAVNMRLAEVAVGNSIKDALQANPALPGNLKEPLDHLAGAYQSIAITQLAGGTRDDSKSYASAADKAITEIDSICR